MATSSTMSTILALIGSLINGAGRHHERCGRAKRWFASPQAGSGVIENNAIENANNIGAVLKIHNGNTNNSTATWTGVYTELFEISDNSFGGTSGQAGTSRWLRRMGASTNGCATSSSSAICSPGTTGAQGGRQLMASAVDRNGARQRVLHAGNGTSTYRDLRCAARATRLRTAPGDRRRGLQQYLLRAFRWVLTRVASNSVPPAPWAPPPTIAMRGITSSTGTSSPVDRA